MMAWVPPLEPVGYRLVDDHLGDSRGVQAQGRGQPGDARTGDDDAHGATLTEEMQKKEPM
ncbi:hypothetical protein ACWDRB_02450 [Nonomuraea sp. NPDC003707]